MNIEDLRERREAEDMFLEMIRRGGEAVAGAAKGPARQLPVVGADGEPVRHNFGGDVRTLTAEWRLSESVGLRAIDAVLASGWEPPRWATVEQVRDADTVHGAGLAWARAAGEVAARIAAHGRVVTGGDALAFRAVGAGPLPDEARPYLEPARDALTIWARRWLGHVGALVPDLQVQPAREVA